MQLTLPYYTEPTREAVLEWALQEGEQTNAQEANVIGVDPFAKVLQRFCAFEEKFGHLPPKDKNDKFGEQQYHYFK